jgi:hypothetical protein
LSDSVWVAEIWDESVAKAALCDVRDWSDEMPTERRLHRRSGNLVGQQAGGGPKSQAQQQVLYTHIMQRAPGLEMGRVLKGGLAEMGQTGRYRRIGLATLEGLRY